MMEIQESRCEVCSYGQIADVKYDPIWCGVHQDYFGRSDMCQVFSNKDYSAVKHSMYGGITRLLTISHHTG